MILLNVIGSVLAIMGVAILFHRVQKEMLLPT